MAREESALNICGITGLRAAAGGRRDRLADRGRPRRASTGVFAAEGARDGDGLERTLGDGQLGAPRFRNLARFSSKTGEKRGNNWVAERK